jgi:hypothetical protein
VIANLCRECQCRQNLRSFSKDRKFVVLSSWGNFWWF